MLFFGVSWTLIFPNSSRSRGSWAGDLQNNVTKKFTNSGNRKLQPETTPMQFSVSLYIHILPHKKIWGQSKLLKYRNNSQKLPRSLENWPKSIRIRISLCFLTKSLPNAFGKDLVKKQRKILMMINFGGCEGVSANYFDSLKASIDIKFFCE